MKETVKMSCSDRQNNAYRVYVLKTAPQPVTVKWQRGIKVADGLKSLIS